jgi:hypothetical protein
MLSTKANVIMVSSGANVIIWCYHVMLSSGMITPPFLFFLETSLTRVIVPGTGSQPSYTASSEQAPIHFTAESSMSGTDVLKPDVLKPDVL